MTDPGNPFQPGGPGSAAGSQALMGQLLQAVNRIAASLAGAGNNLQGIQVYPWTQAGDLTVAAAFPGIQSGIFSIRRAVPAALNVILPSSGGPWGVADGAVPGVAAANHITIVPSAGQTIAGAASDLISTNGGVRLYVIDGANLLRISTV